MKLADYRALGGYMDSIQSLDEVLNRHRERIVRVESANPWPVSHKALQE